ncbi:hypothetical protein FOFC_10054 [Fusarium oxysporum]|nr:hypothetical protein FOFC_10054 [Fusarium oxysporum]
MHWGQGPEDAGVSCCTIASVDLHTTASFGC